MYLVLLLNWCCVIPNIMISGTKRRKLTKVSKLVSPLCQSIDAVQEDTYSNILKEASAITTKSDWILSDAIEHLVSKDVSFKPLVCKYGIPDIYTKIGDQRSDPFYSLLKTIIFQQLQTKAAEVIFDRVVNSIMVKDSKNDDGSSASIAPQDVINSKFEVSFIDGKKKILVNGVVSGLSESKSKYVLSLAEHFNDDNKLKGVTFSNLSDQELFDKLISVKGLGPWSIHIFMMFNLHRPNVLPSGDLGFKRGLFHFCDVPNKSLKEDDIVSLCSSWSPYRSLGSFYMWKLSDEVAKSSRK